MTTPPDSRALRTIRLNLSRRNTARALAIFLLPLSGFAASFVTVLAIGWPWALPLSLIEAWFIGMLFIVGHDACHQSFADSRRLNDVLGRIAMLPSLHNFSLWDLSHNRIHHHYNNVRGFDFVWEPMSPDEYRRAPRLKRVTYRFFRSPLGIPAYYIVVIWWPKIFLVRKRFTSRHGQVRRAYVWDGLLVWAFLLLETAAAILIGAWWMRNPFEAVGLAVVLPFLVWNVLISFVIYLHHTHPRVPWYGSIDEWREKRGAVLGTVHVKFPWLIAKLTLNIMEHNAHHYAPGVPLYNLEAMQAEMHDAAIVEWRWSLTGFWQVVRACKLFDYETEQWRRFGT